MGNLWGTFYVTRQNYEKINVKGLLFHNWRKITERTNFVGILQHFFSHLLIFSKTVHLRLGLRWQIEMPQKLIKNVTLFITIPKGHTTFTAVSFNVFFIVILYHIWKGAYVFTKRQKRRKAKGFLWQIHESLYCSQLKTTTVLMSSSSLLLD